MTNREWLDSLSNEQLVQFWFGNLNCKLYSKSDNGANFLQSCFPVNAKLIFNRYTDSLAGFRHWLAQEQEFTLVNGGVFDFNSGVFDYTLYVY